MSHLQLMTEKPTKVFLHVLSTYLHYKYEFLLCWYYGVN